TRWNEPPVAAIGMLWDVSEEEQSKQEMQTVKAALHDFHGVFAAEGSSLLDTMRALLELGNLHFKTEIGLVAKLQPGAEKRLEVVQALALHESLSLGDVFDPASPASSNFPRALAYASFVCCDEEALLPSVYKATRDATFLGAPIYLQRQLYGVLCFASPQDRPEGFSSSELELVQFIANWLGGEIERRQLIEDFKKKQNSLMEANASLEMLLQNDLLTGLFNKDALDARLEQEFERANAYKQSLSVMAFSPNDLPDYRKRQGDAAWRTALEKIAATIENHSRGFDVVARYDESTFVVVCPQSDVEEARAQTEVIQTALNQIPNLRHKFTVSAGVVSLDCGCANSQELLSDVLDACQLAQLDAVSR
ncbi:MAG: sensor domain-containing diguanylate cyclase, partial [Abditibacteriaceae bacterium]